MGTGDGYGVRLSYRIIGKGKPLIVIHDGPGFEKALMYAGFDDLASEMRVIYYDQRGCGRSEPLTPMISSTIADNVEDLESLRRYFHLGKVCLAAHGWGAVIALEYARRYEEFVDAIVLITPISPFTPDLRAESIIDQLSVETRLEIAEMLNHPTMSALERQEAIMRLVMPALFHRQDACEYVDLEELRISPEVRIRLGEELRSLDLFSVLNEIMVPTLVAVGRHDISTSVRDQMAYADGIRSSSAIVFNDSGHFPFLEERPFFLNAVTEFLLHRRTPAWVQASTVD